LRIIEDEQLLVLQEVEELEDEEGVAGGLRVHTACERLDLGRLQTQGVCDQSGHLLRREWQQVQVRHDGFRAANDGQRSSEGMREVDFVVAIGAEQQQAFELGVRRQMLEQQ
jgi:hypothetical protein